MKEFLLHQLHSVGLSEPALPWWFWALVLVAIIFSTTVHEFGHAWVADKLGDPGPREQGRVTLNPIAHFDPLGFVLMVVTTFMAMPMGWGKPVKVDAERFTSVNRRLGMALVAIAGPVMNLVLATLASFVIRLAMGGYLGDLPDGFYYVFLSLIITTLMNILVFAENLIPVHPMDASHVVAALLPKPLAEVYVGFMQNYGFYLLLLLSLTGALGAFLLPIVLFLLKLGKTRYTRFRQKVRLSLALQRALYLAVLGHRHLQFLYALLLTPCLRTSGYQLALL